MSSTNHVSCYFPPFVRRQFCCIFDLIHPSHVSSSSFPLVFTHSGYYWLFRLLHAWCARNTIASVSRLLLVSFSGRAWLLLRGQTCLCFWPSIGFVAPSPSTTSRICRFVSFPSAWRSTTRNIRHYWGNQDVHESINRCYCHIQRW